MKNSVTTPAAASQRLKNIYHSLYFAPSVVFIAMALITYWSWRASAATLHRDTESAVIDRTSQTQNELTRRLDSYEQILMGGAGLVRGSQNVMKNEWHDYVSTFDVARRYPGLQGVGYVKAFNAAGLPDIITQMQEQGIDFHITPDTPRDFYTAILYVDPDRAPSPVGIDMFTEPSRMKTMAAARDSGQTRITPPVKSLLPDTTQPVIYMYVPQYQSGAALDTAAQRQQALQGYIYARLISSDFFNTFRTSTGATSNMVFQVAAQNAQGDWQTIYKTPDYEQLNSGRNYTLKQQVIDVYGQTWKLDFGFKTSGLLPAQRRNTPAWTVLAGLLLAFLLAEVVFLLLKARANELSSINEEAVDLAKDELLSLASHQLRTPATTVKQYLGMVLQGFAGDLTPTQKSLLDKAYSGNERQLYIINEMLHVAKVDAGRIVLARHAADINKLLQDTVQEARNDIDAANHKLTITLPKKPIILDVDEHMLRMAIENIISNAIKYTLPGGKIKISLNKIQDKVHISVKDSGIGIDPKDVAKLYKLFTRLDNPLTQNIGGTGVGLYLAKHLIELHGGNLTLTSGPNRGSTFTIILPSTTK